jgi:hypothetical protein
MSSLSIVCIDALNYIDTIKALGKTIGELLGNGVPVDRIHWVSDTQFPLNIEIPVTWTKVRRFRSYPADYNWITIKLLPHVVTEDHYLIIHADGFAVNGAVWNNEWLSYDYIGATWLDGGPGGNGGFCLRSRKLMDAMLDMDINHASIDYDSNELLAEDVIICRRYAAEFIMEHQINFAPPDVCDQFSIENNIFSPLIGRSFGFHGKLLLPYYTH